MPTTYWIFGGKLEIVTDENETDGKYDLITGSFMPGTEVPLHLHTKYSESMYVLEGELTVFMKDKTVVLQPGEHVFIPVGVPHCVLASGNTPVKALTVASPSGFAKLIRTVGNETNTPNDMGLFMQVSEEVGDKLLGPPGTRP
jgi:mannose-6-phosphate isomerase-like protein (cupin superfamily)